MIVDLDQILYVIDENTHKHRILSINIREKTVLCEDGNVYEYSTHPITITFG